MIWQAVIAHAPGEEKLAETIANRLLEAGYAISYRGTVLVGESFTEEAGKALKAGGPLILCATVNALGTGWVHHLINSAFAQAHKKRIFALRMERLAYLDQILGDIAVAEYWQDPEQGMQDLLRSLRKHFPLEPEHAPAVPVEAPPAAYLDRTTNISRFNSEALKSFRAELRAGIVRTLPPALDSLEFLQSANLMRNGFLTLTGLLLFGDTPTHALPSALARFTVFSGTTKTTPREPIDLRGTVLDQITGLHQQIASQIRTREQVRADSPKTEVLYEYPMRTIREIVANALVHRDYEDARRWAHMRVFTDRVEILSPGDWVGANLPADGSPVGLGKLVSESVKRNLTLATVVAWAHLVEGEGSGLPTALEECREISAPEPIVFFKDGYITVTIFPRADWAALERPVSLGIAMPALHQLPAPPPDFIGRKQELEQLSKVAQDRVGTILGIQGLGGVGKTTLALRLAERLKPSYPDAQIFLNLRGTSPNPLSAIEAMTHVILSFHPEARLPESEPEITGLYRSVLSGKRILLFLDDAGDRDQIETLIPPPPSLLLLTSRSRFALPGLVVEQLEVLSPAEARTLLLRLAPRIGDTADEIARLCGYLPLALRLAGAFLAERPDLSAQEYIGRLSEAPGEKSPIAGSVRLGYNLLSPELQKHWRGLSVFPSSFDRTAAEAVLALGSEAADLVLGTLVRNSLLEWNEHGRYYSHPLLRSFAESQLDAAEGHGFRLRHAEHYLKVLAKTSDLYVQGGEGLRQALELFDREWDNVRSGFFWTAAHASEDEAIAYLCASYPNAGAYCLDLRLSPREHIRWLEPALEATRQLADPTIAAVHLGNLGNAYMSLGEIDRAIPLYQEWLKVAHETGDRQMEGAPLGNLGIAYAALGETQRAIEFFEQHLAIARAIGDRRAEGISLGNLGIAYAALGEARHAIDLFEQHLVIAREIGDRRAEGTSLGNLGIAYAALGEHRRAIDLFEQHLVIAREIGDRHGEGVALGRLGDAYVALGEPGRASELYQQAIALLHEIGDRPREAEISERLGSVSVGVEGVDDAEPSAYPRG